MAGDAVLLELAPMGVRVADRALIALQLYLDGRLDVARRAFELGVPALQRESCPGVVDLLRLEGIGQVAACAVRTERLLVRVGMAVRARLERDSLELSILVTLRAVGRDVRSGQREGRPLVVERLAGKTERVLHIVASGAIVPEDALVHILVATRAGRARIQERTALVARHAVRRQLLVLTLDREPGLRLVIDLLRIEVAQLRIGPHVLHVTGDTVVLHIAVDSLLRLDSLRYRPVTGKAASSRDLPALLVALLTVLDAFERGMRLGERPRRDKRSQLRDSVPGSRESHCSEEAGSQSDPQ
jgi:hypothetical protein